MTADIRDPGPTEIEGWERIVNACHERRIGCFRLRVVYVASKNHPWRGWAWRIAVGGDLGGVEVAACGSHPDDLLPTAEGAADLATAWVRGMAATMLEAS